MDGQLLSSRQTSKVPEAVLQQGSTTACVLCLEGEQLHAANVGDSGFMVIRGSEVVFKSPPQQHSFNFPFQLGPRDKGYQTPSDAQVCPSSQLVYARSHQAFAHHQEVS